MRESVNVCICVPEAIDNRTPAQKAEMDRRFHELHPGLRFEYLPYCDSDTARGLRGQPLTAEAARDLVEPPGTALKASLSEAEVILAFDLPFDMDILAPKLRWVQAMGAGVGHLQTCGLERRSVLLTSAAGIAAGSIAEFVLARILSHWKRLPDYAVLQARHTWEHAPGRRLAGSTLAVVGYGAIGSAIARRAKALGMRVTAIKRNLPVTADPDVDAFFRAESLHEMLAGADAVALCAAETPETRRMFDAAAFGAMKPGGFFCNVSRGSLVDEDALVQALAAGRLGGAAIDVTVNEPLPPDSALWDCPGLAISPHSATSPEDYHRLLWELFFENMRRYLAGDPLANTVAAGFDD